MIDLLKYTKRLLTCVVACMFLTFGVTRAVYACNADEIDVNDDGTNCQAVKFTITTTEVDAGDNFRFFISATGTFYVDCGEEGTLSGIEVSGKTITHTDAYSDMYTCTYSSGGIKTIRMGGLATGYVSSRNIYGATISFSRPNSIGTPEMIASIDGSLGAIFPTLGDASSQRPYFYYTFGKCINLVSIPENLFSGISSAANNMFRETFYGCTGLTSIPENLFPHVSDAANDMFRETFHGCTGLTSIPENLFPHVSDAADGMFIGTFQGCTGLTSIPKDLFSGVSGAASAMFSSTFQGCTGLTSIPRNLFSGVTGAAEQMFDGTFAGCTGLTSIPRSLFLGVSDAASFMFWDTFSDCSNLSGYIPSSTFGGLIAKGSPNADYMWDGIFNGTQLATSCPNGTVQYITGYEGDDPDESWNGKVSCVPTVECPKGEYMNEDTGECTPCAIGSYSDEIGLNECIACPAGMTTSDVGAISCDVECPNSLAAHEWNEPEWDYNTNTVTNLCVLNACDGGYFPIINDSGNSCMSCAEATNGTYPRSSRRGVSVARVQDTYDGDGRRACFFYKGENNGFHIENSYDMFLTPCPAGTYSNWTEVDEEDLQPVSGQALHYGESYDCDVCPWNTFTTGGATECTECLENYSTKNTSPYMCRIKCDGGYYLKNPNDTECSPVGEGHYMPEHYVNQGEVSEYGICPDGTTTVGYGIGADESDDCGPILHVGADKLYLRSRPLTEHALKVKLNGNVYYGNMSTDNVKMSYDTDKLLKVKLNNTVYSVWDETVRMDEPEPQIVLHISPDVQAIVINPPVYNDASGMEWSVIMGDENETELSGMGGCSETTGRNGDIAEEGFEPEGEGGNCWCKITSPVQSSRWVMGTPEHRDCQNKCGYLCANNMKGTKVKNKTYRTNLYSISGIMTE